MNADKVGYDQIQNRSAIVRVQNKLGLYPDGWPGDKTWAAIQEALGVKIPTPPVLTFPNEDYRSMVNFYGQPGDESNLVRIKFPYPMRLYTRSAPANVTGHSCHNLVAESLVAVLTEILETYGLPWIQENGLDVFGGIYNDRNTRSGGHSKSKHAWGVAIDLNPAENGLYTPWTAKANMPHEAIEIFEKHGWKSLARVIGRDAMHFEATT